MDLYYCDTTNPRKVCALARYLELPVTYHYVDLFQGEQHSEAFGLINPNRKVPVLVDQQRHLFESTAIMLHMAQTAQSSLWPEDNATQTEIIQWLSWDNAHLSRHASTVYFEHVIKSKVGIASPDAAAVDEAIGFFRQFASVLDAQLAHNQYVAGDALTIADFGVACVLTVAAEMKLDQLPVAEYPAITTWLARMSDIPAWRKPWPQKK